jgi:cystathionine beta-lyase/cystathionine gamma-synthase
MLLTGDFKRFGSQSSSVNREPFQPEMKNARDSFDSRVGQPLGQYDSRDLIEKVTHLLNHLGGCLDPHACFLLYRGLKTLAVRVRYQNESALKIAQFLEGQDAIASVRYAGLQSHPRHSRANELFSGFGGVLSFELSAGVEAAEKFIRGLRLARNAPSLGGVETLLMRPAVTSHAGIAAEERRRLELRMG